MSKKMKINFLGDSITEGAFATCTKNQFVEKVGQYLNAVVRNYGISGTRIAIRPNPSPDPSWDLFFGGRVKDMDSDADYVIVFGGTNDYGNGGCLLGNIDDQDPRTFAGGMNYLIKELLKKYDKYKLIFMIPLYREGEEYRHLNGVNGAPGATLQEIREVMYKVLNKNNIKILDLKDEMGKADNNPLLEDGLHPNDEGHDKLARLIVNYIKSLWKEYQF